MAKSDNDKTEARGKFWGSLIGTVVITVGASFGLTSLQTSDAVKSAKAQAKAAEERAKADAALRTREIDERVKRLYEENLAPVLVALIRDVKRCRDVDEEVHKLHDELFENGVMIEALSTFHPRRTVAARYDWLYEEQHRGRRPRPHEDESSAAQRILDDIVQRAAARKRDARLLLPKAGELPSYELVK